MTRTPSWPRRGSSGDLIKVEEGANLEVAGNISLRGRYNSGSIISSNGEVVISGDAHIYDGKAGTTSTGVINVTGDKATLEIEGGTINKSEIADTYCGAVRIANGARATISGGTICENRVATASGDGNYLSSAGVMVMDGGRLEMDGGRIENNSGYQGSAVVVYSPNAGEDKRSTFAMTGGEIARNQSSKLGKRTPSGAVHVEGNAEFTMAGGEINNNSVGSDGKGGGVCVVDPGIQDGSTKMNTVFIMGPAGGASTRASASAGPVISGNTAYAGGGIYSYSDGVTLKAGTIRDNKAWSMGGGIYSEGNETHYSTLNMENAEISANKASKQGGGLWFCPTGDAKVYIQDGALIGKNSSEGVGDDFVFTGFAGDSHKLTLADRAPGGARVWWYEDGGMFPPSGMYAANNDAVPRFDPNNKGDAKSYTEATPNVALKAQMGDAAYEMAKARTRLLITGNEATRGGGVGANGGLVIGKDDPDARDISVKKIWKGDESDTSTRPVKITVNLKLDGTVIDSIELTAPSWEGSFTKLPSDIADDRYSVEEEKITDYELEKVEGDATSGFTVTNTYKPSGGVGGPDPGPDPTPTPTPTPTPDPTPTPEPDEPKPDPGTPEPSPDDPDTPDDPADEPSGPDEDEPDTPGDQDSKPASDSSPATPQTSDSSHTTLWLVLALATMLVGCSMIAVSSIRRPRGAHSMRKR